MTNLPLNLMISVLFLVGIIALIVFVQIKLSQSKSKYLGLILPVISFVYSLMLVFGIAAFSVGTMTMTGTVLVSEVDEESGEVIEYSEESIAEAEEIVEVREFDSSASSLFNLGFFFMVSNIPTVVLAGIYVSERNKIKMRSEIEKMKISDL